MSTTPETTTIGAFAPATLLASLLAAARGGPADQLRDAARALAIEIRLNLLPDPSTDVYRPSGTDVLLVVDLPHSEPRGLGWIVLRLLNTERAAVELWARPAPYARTLTIRESMLAECPLTADADPSAPRDWNARVELESGGYIRAALGRFVAECHARQVL